MVWKVEIINDQTFSENKLRISQSCEMGGVISSWFSKMAGLQWVARSETCEESGETSFSSGDSPTPEGEGLPSKYMWLSCLQLVAITLVDGLNALNSQDFKRTGR